MKYFFRKWCDKFNLGQEGDLEEFVEFEVRRDPIATLIASQEKAKKHDNKDLDQTKNYSGPVSTNNVYKVKCWYYEGDHN